MKVLILLCVGLLMDHAEALRESRQNYTGENGNRSSIHTLDCKAGYHVLVADVRVFFTGAESCNDPCYYWPSDTNFNLYLKECENKSRCKVSVPDMQHPNGENISAEDAEVIYECSSAPAVLAMDRPGSVSGRTVAARFSSPDLQSSNSSWQCRVEASDKSTIDTTVHLLIRNGKDEAKLEPSSFFSTTNVRRLGWRRLWSTSTMSSTPFTVTLHLVEGSRVYPAYVLVTADSNVTMTCEHCTVISETSFCKASSEESTCAVGPAVGGTVAALLVVEVVVVIIVFVWRARFREKNAAEEVPAVSLPPGHPKHVDNAYEEAESAEANNYVAVDHAAPRDDRHSVHAGAASAVTSGDDKSYDVLGKKRPTADAKRDVIYHRLNENSFTSDEVEYSNDRAGKSRRRYVVTSAIYTNAAAVSLHVEAGPEDVEYSYNRAGERKNPEVITDSVYHVIKPESPAAEDEQVDASKVKTAAQQNVEVADDWAEGPIYSNSEAF